MPFVSHDPASDRTLNNYPALDATRLHQALERAAAAQQAWRLTDFSRRAEVLRKAAQRLVSERDHYAVLITQEMGKPLREARAEVEKCATACNYYAEHGERFMQAETVASDAGKSYIAYQPLGVVFAIMPWNFPFWQVFRAAAPALMAGNALVLKHAPNVPQCGLAIATLFEECGLPPGVFSNLMLEVELAAEAIANPHVHAVTLTGSEAAGRKVATLAGQHLKKCVLELGGSDPFVVLGDADLQLAVDNAILSRYLNGGQSCIAAKRFIVVPGIADEFVARLKARVEALVVGDPMDEATQVGPMARRDLRDTLHRQVSESIARGAVKVCGCAPQERPGFFYQPSILDHVVPGMPAFDEELFGPVAAIVRVEDEAEALRVANDTRYGLGASVWSRDAQRAENMALHIEAGCTFVNGMVKSDPRLPFGGVKASGYGRELSLLGMREFVNAKTVWVR